MSAFFAVKHRIWVFKKPQSVITMATLPLVKLRLSMIPSLSLAVGICGMGAPRYFEVWAAIALGGTTNTRIARWDNSALCQSIAF
jgi:hypothetical protein